MHLHHSGKENVSFPFCHEAPPCSDARVSASGDLHCTDTPDGGPTDQLCLRTVRAQGSCASCPGHRPFCTRTLTWVPGVVGSHAKESAAMHRLPYRGGVRLNPLCRTPLRALLARPWPAHAAPRSSPLFARRPRSTWVSRRTVRQVVNPTVEELRVRPAHKDSRSGAGTMDAGRPDPQLWCALAHTQAPMTEMPTV